MVDAHAFVYMRDALELLNITVSQRKRLLIAAALGRSGPPDCDRSIFWRAIEYAETAAELGHPKPDREALHAELVALEEYFPCEAWHGIAEVCVQLTPWLRPQGLGFWEDGERLLVEVFRDLVPNPFVPLDWKPEWCSSTVVDLARTMYDRREFGGMPILADALMDAGCDHQLVLDHCRAGGPHARGCWVLDRILGRE